jgi:hypothetical protein
MAHFEGDSDDLTKGIENGGAQKSCIDAHSLI